MMTEIMIDDYFENFLKHNKGKYFMNAFIGHYYVSWQILYHFFVVAK